MSSTSSTPSVSSMSSVSSVSSKPSVSSMSSMFSTIFVSSMSSRTSPAACPAPQAHVDTAALPMSYAGGAALTPSNTAGFGVGALTKGDTDGSSYSNDDLRGTHTASGYLASGNPMSYTVSAALMPSKRAGMHARPNPSQANAKTAALSMSSAVGAALTPPKTSGTPTLPNTPHPPPP